MPVEEGYRQELDLDRKQEQRWIDSFVASSSDALIAFDEKLRIRFLNPTASQIFKREVSEIIGASLQTLGYLGAILSPLVSKVQQTGSVVQSTFEMPDNDDVIVFEGSFNPAFAADGQIQGVFGVLRDITSRHKMAEELQASKKRLETQSRALEVYDVVSETDLTGRLIFVNDRFCELTGFTRNELIGDDYRKINSGYHSKLYFKRMWRKISRGEVWTGEIRNRSKDGQIFWVQTIIAPLFDDDGRLDRFLAIQRDITRKRTRRQKDEEFIQRFHQILQNSHSMIISTDLRANIIFANAPFLKATGMEEEQVLTLSWIDQFIPVEQRKEVQRLWLDSVNRRKEAQFEATILTTEGKTREVIWNLSPLQNEDAEIFGMTLVGEDVTERRTTQEAMEGLQEEVRTKTQNVLSFVSHQLKNGLLSINAGLDMIGEELKAEAPDQERIQKLSHKIKSRTHDLESFSKELLQNFAEDRSSFRLKLQTFSLKGLLIDVIDRFKTDHRDKPIEFLLDLPRQDIIVNWDVLKVDELITNLLSNAVKYLKPEGGKVELKARKIHENVLLTVADNGIGIPPDSLESLFEWFSRGKVSHMKKRGGFGVGLRFSKEVVAKHEGRIWLESKEEVGTQFHCLLPQDPKRTIKKA